MSVVSDNSLALLLFSALLPLAAAAQPIASDGASEEGTRQLWDENLRSKRPVKVVRQIHTPSMQRAGRNSSPSEQLGDAFVGFTLWKLRPSRSGDDQDTRRLVHEEDSGNRCEASAERVMGDAPLPEGSKVRVSIEPARTGYLYIIDREKYADGSYSEPYLIFPTTRIRGGNNLVGPGIVVELPDPGETVPYFTLRRNRAKRIGGAAENAPEQVSEELTILVAPKPLPGVQIGRSAQRLSKDEVAAWEKQWTTATKSLDAHQEAGKAQTKSEKQAAQTGTQLAAEDPLPQTLIQAAAKPGDPLLVTVPIKIAK